MAKSIYFAGSLFNHKDLTGNMLLARAIELASDKEYTVSLPQNIEFGTGRSVDIRDSDIKAIMSSDLALFNFDGTDLDSGTVVEFMIAKFLDIPSVIIRTDFRKSGDQEIGGDSWNLMCSFYPRTETVTVNSMELYNECNRDVVEIYNSLSSLIIEKFDLLVKTNRVETKLTKRDVYEYLYTILDVDAEENDESDEEN